MNLSSHHSDGLRWPVRCTWTCMVTLCSWVVCPGAILHAQAPRANQPVALPEATPPVVLSAPATTKPSDAISEDALDLIAGDAALEVLLDKVMALPVAEDRDIATVVSLSPDAEMAIRRDVAGNHLLTRGHTSLDGQLHSVTAWISIEHLNLLLRRILIEHFPNIDAKQVGIAASPDAIVRGTGTIAVSQRPVIDLPGWRHVDARRKTLAEQSCRDDAFHRMLTTIRRLRLTPQQTVEDLMRASPPFGQAVRSEIRDLLPAELVHDRSGLCTMTIRLERADLIRLLARAAHEAKLKARVDFSQARDAQLQTSWNIEAYGLLPPQRDVSSHAPTSEALPDGWPGGYLQASARAAAPVEFNSRTERYAWAERLARVEAGRRLWLQLEALPWRQNTVGHLLSTHPERERIVQSLNRLVVQTPPTGRPETALPLGQDETVEIHLRISLPMAAETLQAFDPDVEVGP